MKMFLQKFLRAFLFFALGFTKLTFAQTGVFDVNDPIVIYDANNPPAKPPFGQVSKWVKTDRMNWSTTTFKSYFYKGVAFRLKFPKSYQQGVADGKTYPLFLFWHGIGERGEIYDNEYQLYHGGQLHGDAVDNGNFDGFLLYPQSNSAQGFFGDSYYDVIADLIQNLLIPQVKVDPNRILVDGLSGGGTATWQFSIRYPKLVAGILPISAASISFEDAVESLKWTPIWQFQGGLDLAPNPNTTIQVVNAYQNAGGNIKYTVYPDQGHGCWYSAWTEPDYFPFLNRAHKANPWPLTGRTEFCPGDAINVTMGVTAGFDGYEWRKDGQTIQGATTNQITVNSTGTYDCRIKRGTDWSPWSPIPVVIKIKAPTVTPPITVSGIMSKFLPAPDGRDSVTLQVPAGYQSYLWQSVDNTTTLSTTRFLTVKTPGSYKAKVTELYGCSSDFSQPFTVLAATGPNAPDPATNLVVSSLSKTSLKLNWSDNPNPINNETGFEIYRGETAGGPYKLITITGADVHTYTDAGLNPGTTYYYIIRSVGNSSAGPVSVEGNGKTQTDNTAPTAPSNLRITGSTRSSIALQWDPSTDDVGVTKYDVYINGIKSYVTTGTVFTVNNLTYGKGYNFSVRARDFANNVSPYSNQITGQALMKGLLYNYYTFVGTWNNLPDLSQLTPIASGQTSNVTIAPSTEEDNFAFLWQGYIRIPVAGNYTFRTNSDDGSTLYLGGLNQTGSAYNYPAAPLVNNDGLHGGQNADGTITLQPGIYPIAMAYYEQGGGQVMTVSWQTPQTGGAFVSIPDSVFADQPIVLGQPPVKPSNLTATPVSFKRIDLSWTDNSNNETGFEIYRATSASGNFAVIGKVGANTTTFADSSLNASTKYYYKIRAIGQYGESGFDRDGAGVNYSYYEVANLGALPDFNSMTPKKTGRVANFGLGLQDRGDGFEFKFDGVFNAPTAGSYTFYTASDDGSRLYIDGFDAAHLVVDNDGLHGTVERSGTVNLSAGAHNIYVTFFENGGGEALIVNMAGPGFAKAAIPDSLLGSPNISATTLSAPFAPTVPTALTASGISSTRVNVNWNYNPNGSNTSSTSVKVEAESYTTMSGVQTENTADAGGGQNVGWIDTGDFMVYSLNGGSAAGNATVSFRVASPNNGGQLQLKKADGTVLATVNIPNTGGWQNWTTVTTTANLPAGQQNLTVYVSSGGWNINWFQVDKTVNTTYTANANSFELYRSNNTADNYVLLATVPGTTTSYTDSSLFANATYYYKVRAINLGGNSDYSNADSAITWNGSPTIVSIPEQRMRYGTQLNLNVQGSDNDGDSVTVAFTNLPSFATCKWVSKGNWVVTFNPASTDQGTFENITATVTDQHGATASTAFRLIVNDNYNPAITGVSNVTVSEKQTAQLTISASDQNVGNVISWSFTGLPGFITPTINNNSVLFNMAPGYSDNGTYRVQVKADDGNGGADTTSFIVTVNDVNPNKKIYFNFNDGTSTATGVWNNISKAPALNDNWPGMKDDAGNTTSVGLQIMTPWQNIGNGSNVQGVNTGKNSGVYPDAVIRSAYWTNQTKQTLKIYGLDQTGLYKYNFTFFGSRASVPDSRMTNYTIKGTTVSLEATNNSQNTVTASGITPDAGGVLNLDLKNGTGSTYAYLNAMVIEAVYDDGSVPAKPRNLAASVLNNKAQLNWVDAAYNENAYEIYRSTSRTGTYTLINPGGNNANLQQYSDSDVYGNSTYYYAVRAINSYGSSAYSDTVAVTMPNTPPVLTKIADVKMKTQQISDINVTATDPGDNITLTVTGLPAFATFTNTGNGTGVIHLDVKNNVGTFKNVTITATDNKGAASSQTFNIVVADKDINSIYVNFNQVTPVGAPWNSFNSAPTAGKVLSNLADESSTSTTIGVTLVDGWEGANNVGAVTGNNSGVFPDDVMSTAYYESTSNIKRVRITGLNTTGSTRYNLVFFASRVATDNRTTNYTVQGKTVTLNAANNTSNVVQINGLVPDATGTLEVSVQKGTGSTYAYLGAMVIQSYLYDPNKVLAPSGLTAIGRSKSSIALTWSDKSDNEDGFEIYRSTSYNGTYTLVTTTGANATAYLDQNLQKDVSYFYKIRAKSGSNYSDYTAVAMASTYSFNVLVNFNRDNPAASPWNNTNKPPMLNDVYSNFKNDENNPSGINMTVTKDFSGDNPFGMNTGNNSGVFPDNVISSSWWVDAGATSQVKISGLNQSLAYTFVFFGSRNSGGDRTSVYTIGSRSVSLNASYNTSQTVQLDNVKPDENGEVFVTVSLASGATFAYLGAMVITGYQIPTVDTTNMMNSGATIVVNNPSSVNNTLSRVTNSGIVNNELTVQSIHVYPNPFSDNVTVTSQFSKPAGHVRLRLVDMSGRVLREENVGDVNQGQWSYRMGLPGNISPGNYLIQLISNNSPVPISVKVIKTK